MPYFAFFSVFDIRSFARFERREKKMKAKIGIYSVIWGFSFILVAFLWCLLCDHIVPNNSARLDTLVWTIKLGKSHINVYMYVRDIQKERMPESRCGSMFVQLFFFLFSIFLFVGAVSSLYCSALFTSKVSDDHIYILKSCVHTIVARQQ